MSKLLITFIYCYYYYYDCYFVLCWSPNSDDHRYAPPIDADKRTTAFLQNFVIGYQTVPPHPQLSIDRYKIPKSSYHQAVGKPAKMEKYKYAKTRYKYATIVKPYSKKPFHFGYSLAKPASNNNNNNHPDSAAIPWSIKPLPPPLSTTTAPPTPYSEIINGKHVPPPWTLQALPPPVATRTPRTMDSTMINNNLPPPNDWVLSPLPPPVQSTSPMLRGRPQNIHQLVVPVKVNQYYLVDRAKKKQFPKQKLNSRPSDHHHHHHHHRMIIHIETYNSPSSRSSSDADNLLAHSSTGLPEYSIDSRYERRKRSVIIESVKIPNSKRIIANHQPTDGTDHDRGSKYNRLFKLFPVNNNRHHRFGVLSPLKERGNFNMFNERGYADDLSSSNITKFANKNYPKQNSTIGPVRFERQPAVSIQNIIRGNNSGSHNFYNNNNNNTTTNNKSNFPSPTAIINTLIAGGNSPRLMKMNILTLNNLATDDYDDWSPNRTAAAAYLLANPRRAINFNTTAKIVVDGGYWKNLAEYEKFGMRLNRTFPIKNETINVADAVVMTGASVAKTVYQRVNHLDNSMMLGGGGADNNRVNQNQSSISDNRPPPMKQTIILGGYNYATPYVVSNMIQSFSPPDDREQSSFPSTLLTSTVSTDTISSTGLAASTVNDIEQFSLPPGLVEPYLQSSDTIPDYYYYRYDKTIKNAEKQDREMPAPQWSSSSSLVSPFVIDHPEDYYDNFEQPVSAAAIPTATIRLPLTMDDITWFDDRNRSVENNNFVLITQRPAQSYYNSLLPISSNLTGGTFDVGQGYSSSVLQQQGDTTPITTGADYTNFVHLDGNNYERTTTASSSIGNPTYFYHNFHQSPSYDHRHSGFIDFSATTPLPNPTTSTAATIRDNLFPPAAAKYAAVDFTGNLADFLDGTATGVDVRNSHLDELNLEFFQPIIIDVDKQIEREQQRLFGVNGDKTESSYQRIKPLSSPPEFHQTSPLSAQKLRIKVNDLLSSSSGDSGSSSTTTTTVRYTEPVRMPDNLHESTMDIVLHKKSLRHPPVFDLEPQSSEIKSTSSQLVDLPSN